MVFHTGEHPPEPAMTRYHRTDETGEFDRLTAQIDEFEYELTDDRTTSHFHGERHDDKYLPSGRKPESTTRLASDGGIQIPERVRVAGRDVEFMYDDLLGERVDDGEIFEVEYDADAGHITRLAVRVHYADEYGDTDAEGFDVIHVIDLTDGGPTHVTCWLNRKEDNRNRDGNTGE